MRLALSAFLLFALASSAAASDYLTEVYWQRDFIDISNPSPYWIAVGNDPSASHWEIPEVGMEYNGAIWSADANTPGVDWEQLTHNLTNGTGNRIYLNSLTRQLSVSVSSMLREREWHSGEYRWEVETDMVSNGVNFSGYHIDRLELALYYYEDDAYWLRVYGSAVPEPSTILFLLPLLLSFRRCDRS